jgi:hypothetical protein
MKAKGNELKANDERPVLELMMNFFSPLPGNPSLSFSISNISRPMIGMKFTLPEIPERAKCDMK